MKADIFIQNYIQTLKKKIAELENKAQNYEHEDCPYLEHGYICECDFHTSKKYIRRIDKLKENITKLENYAK